MEIYIKLPLVLQDIVKEYHEETGLYLLSIHADDTLRRIQHMGHILGYHCGRGSKYCKKNKEMYKMFNIVRGLVDTHIYKNFKDKPFFVLNEMKFINPENIFYCFKSCLCGLSGQKGKLKKSLNIHQKKEIINIYDNLKGATIGFNLYNSKEYIIRINKHISIIEDFLYYNFK